MSFAINRSRTVAACFLFFAVTTSSSFAKGVEDPSEIPSKEVIVEGWSHFLRTAEAAVVECDQTHRRMVIQSDGSVQDSSLTDIHLVSVMERGHFQMQAWENELEQAYPVLELYYQAVPKSRFDFAHKAVEYHWLNEQAGYRGGPSRSEWVTDWGIKDLARETRLSSKGAWCIMASMFRTWLGAAKPTDTYAAETAFRRLMDAARLLPERELFAGEQCFVVALDRHRANESRIKFERRLFYFTSEFVLRGTVREVTYSYPVAAEQAVAISYQKTTSVYGVSFMSPEQAAAWTRENWLPRRPAREELPSDKSEG